MNKLLAAMVLVICGQEAPPTFESKGGSELIYRVLMPADFKGDRKAAVQKTIDVLQKRLKGTVPFEIQPFQDDMVQIRLLGVTEKAALDAHKLRISAQGRLELKKVATKEMHEKYNETKEVPAGFVAIRADRADAERAIGEFLLAESVNVVTTDDVASAEAEQGQFGWLISFTMTDAAARRFDDAAKALYEMNPHGQIAIVVDGKVVSAPIVHSPSFKGKGAISGNFDEKGAKELAATLKTGALPFPIGCKKSDGTIVEREAEFEGMVGPQKPKK